jgi:CRISPR-associated endoribonuclease Cas6
MEGQRLEMRIKLTLEATHAQTLALPRQYNELIQGFLYRHLDRWLAEALHNEGLPDPQSTKRRLRMFTFSRLQGRFSLEKDSTTIIFRGPVRLVVASPLEPFLNSLLEHLLKERRLRLGGQEVRLLDAAIESPPLYESPVRVETLSPITVYRTLYTAEGKRKTYYYSPFEDEFEELLLENLQRKLRTWRAWRALITPNGKPESEGGEARATRIRPRKVSPRDEHVLTYKGTVIKAWTGVYELDLPPALCEMAFDAGLGAKNSQGFGCIGLWEPKPKAKRGRDDRDRERKEQKGGRDDA